MPVLREQYAKMLDMKPIEKMVIGKTEEEATTLIDEQLMSMRVLERNGNHFKCTYDYSMNRVNLYIKDDLVYRAEIG